MKMGIVTPVLHMNPRFDPPGWEETGSVEDVVAVARAAENVGIDWVACSEHIGIPESASGIRGGRYFDPFTTLGFIAAHTERVGLLTHMTVLPYHHPLEIVKRLGTLDVLSHGRVILGVGVGSLQPEFELLGHQFAGRGDRSDDAIRAIRASWGVRVPVYEGDHYKFSGFIVEPSGLPRPVKVWVGGRTKRSLRRAVELGHAWMPFRLELDELGSMLQDPAVRKLMGDRDEALDMIFAPEPPVDPIGAPDATRQTFRSYASAGATGLSMRFRHDSRSHYVEQMEAAVALLRESGD
ncbi:MAG: TIGR03619 family F420-dependent LLM class oxidoreductase [Acidimicrobiales bacterium]